MNRKAICIWLLLVVAATANGCYPSTDSILGISAADDSERLKKEYEALNSELNEDGTKKYSTVSIDKDNNIKYLTYEELIDFTANKTGLLYFGRPGCPWCRLLLPIMLDYAKENNVTVYYYDIENDRTENNERYKSILSLFSEQLPSDEVTQNEDDPDFDPDLKRMVLPQLFFMKAGEVRADLMMYQHEYLENDETEKVKQLLKDSYAKTRSQPCDC